MDFFYISYVVSVLVENTLFTTTTTTTTTTNNK